MLMVLICCRDLEGVMALIEGLLLESLCCFRIWCCLLGFMRRHTKGRGENKRIWVIEKRRNYKRTQENAFWGSEFWDLIHGYGHNLCGAIAIGGNLKILVPQKCSS